MATKSRRRAEAAALAALTLCACQPGAPPGVDKDRLDEAVSRAVGDPNTCVLIAERGSGRVLYRYNTATACAKEYPGCEGPGGLKLGRLLKVAAQDGRPRQLSCYTLPDRSRSVGWAAGPIAGRPWVYAAVMEGDRAFPGLMMADRLQGAFRRAKVSTTASPQ
jgi:hypothetical protein